MFTERTTARIVGVLFIVATATAIAGGALLLPIDEAGFLTSDVSDGALISGAVLELILVLSVIGIAVLLFPILRRRNEGLALGYVGARIMESALLLAATVAGMSVVALRGEVVGSAATDAEPLIDLLLLVRDQAYLLGSMVMLGVGGLILYALLYLARLVPSWLSLWGLVAAALILIRGLVELYGVEFGVPMQAVLAAPIALQEMVMAVWLIVRGFAPSAPTTDRDRRLAAVGS